MFDIPSRDSVSILLSADNCFGLPPVHFSHIATSTIGNNDLFAHSVWRVPHRQASISSARHGVGLRLPRVQCQIT